MACPRVKLLLVLSVALVPCLCLFSARLHGETPADMDRLEKGLVKKIAMEHLAQKPDDLEALQALRSAYRRDSGQTRIQNLKLFDASEPAPIFPYLPYEPLGKKVF